MIEATQAVPFGALERKKITQQDLLDAFGRGATPTGEQLKLLGWFPFAPKGWKQLLLIKGLEIGVWREVVSLNRATKNPPPVLCDQYAALAEFTHRLSEFPDTLKEEPSFKKKAHKMILCAEMEIKAFDVEFNRLLQRLKHLGSIRERRAKGLEKFRSIYATRKAELYEERRKEANRILADESLRIRIMGVWDNCCATCKAREDLTIDHIISVWDNGSNEESNFQVLCRPCNSRKGKKSGRLEVELRTT